MMTKPCWEQYLKDGTIGDDDTLIEMINDVCNAFVALCKIDGENLYRLVYTHLSQVYMTLRAAAAFRKIQNIRNFGS